MAPSLCLLFPGQGAQYVGMGKSFHDAYAVARETFQEADDLLHYNLSQTIFSGPEDALTATKIAQPAIFVASMAILNVLKKHFELPLPICVAGLSLGEYTALTAAGNFNYHEALLLVDLRGKCMHDACEKTKGGMLVIMGLSDDEVRSLVEGLSLPNDLWCANFNCPGQVVVSGTFKGLEIAKEKALNLGAKRVLPLKVHGAFHSGLMAGAREKLERALASATICESKIPCAMNTTGAYSRNVEDIRSLLGKQVTSSVLWHQCIRTCEGSGISHFLEIGCGKTLSGLNKRIGVSTPTVSIEKVEDLSSLEPLL